MAPSCPTLRPRLGPSAASSPPAAPPTPAAPPPPTPPSLPAAPPPPAASLPPAAPPPSARTAEQPNRRLAEPPDRQAALAAEPPDRRAAQQPSRLAVEPPSSRAARPPSRPAPSNRAARPPSCRAAEPPDRRAAEPPDRPTCLGRAVDFEVWVDDLQLFLQCDRADGLSLFDLTSGASLAAAADADANIRSQWATRDAAARLAVHRHLPTTERAHFSQFKSAHTLYDAVVARYSSPATAALSRLMLPYLFPDLAAFPTVADLITHLRTSDTHYRVALPAEFCAKTPPPPPPCTITLYYIVTRLPDSLRVVRDHFLSVCPTTLTVDLLEKALLAIVKSIVAAGASRGDPRTLVFEGCSPSPLLPSVASAAAADLVGFESVGAASAPSGRRRTGKGKGGKGAGGAGGGGGCGSGGSEGSGGGGGSGAGGGGGGGSSEAAEAVEVAEGAEAAEVVEEAEVEEAAEAAAAAEAAVVERVATLRRGVAPVVVSTSSSSGVV
ncbi:unnamed protein product [Closterium sp. NIES-65]|nr:unnamed protein product [Closterium sp. NIES-65]